MLGTKLTSVWFLRRVTKVYSEWNQNGTSNISPTVAANMRILLTGFPWTSLSSPSIWTKNSVLTRREDSLSRSFRAKQNILYGHVDIWSQLPSLFLLTYRCISYIIFFEWDRAMLNKKVRQVWIKAQRVVFGVPEQSYLQPHRESTSSMNIMAGLFCRADSNNVLTSFSLSPCHFDIKSALDTENIKNDLCRVRRIIWWCPTWWQQLRMNYHYGRHHLFIGFDWSVII